MLDAGIIGAISGAIVLVLGKLGEWYFSKRKVVSDERTENVDLSLKVNQETVSLYKDIITSLKADMTELLHRHTVNEEEHRKCREENIKLNNIIQANAKEIDVLKSRVTELEAFKAIYQ